MHSGRILNSVYSIIFISFMVFMSGCGMNYYEALDKEFKKNPAHLQNVPPSGPTAIDGVWFNPAVGEQYEIISGREIYVVRLTSQDPINPVVMVKDIKQVAPGRYRGTSMNSTGNISHVAYSIISEDKLLAGGLVYDKVKLINEKWFLDEYNAFLKETRGRVTAPVQSTVKNVLHSDQPDSSNLQVNRGDAIPKVIIHRIYTEPAKVMPGIKFKLFVDYTVSDMSVNTTALPVIFNLEILKSKNPLLLSTSSTSDAPTPNSSRLVHTFDTVEITSINGKRNTKVVHLTATNEKGAYYLAARLTCKEQSTTSYHRFTIK